MFTAVWVMIFAGVLIKGLVFSLTEYQSPLVFLLLQYKFFVSSDEITVMCHNMYDYGDQALEECETRVARTYKESL